MIYSYVKGVVIFYDVPSQNSISSLIATISVNLYEGVGMEIMIV